jgi:hypothetical protein
MTMLTSEQPKTSRVRSNAPSPRDTLTRYTDAATDVLARTIVNFQREGNRERELRDAQFAARMAELGSRIQSVEELERRLAERLATIKDGRDGADGRSVVVDDVRPVVEEYVERVLAGWDRPKDGQSVTVDDVEPVLRDMVEAAVARIPSPKDGRDGKDGVSVDPETIRQMIADAVALIPVPKDGKDGVDGRDGKDGVSVDPADVARMVSEAVALIPPAPAGKDADPELVAALVGEKVREAVEALPPPEKGERGEKGDKGDAGPMGSLPSVEEWQDRVYYEGQICSLDGAVYQARRDTGKAPGHEDWRCIVQRGANGADGKDGPQGPQGKQGKPGQRGERGAGAVRQRLSEDGQHQITTFSDGSEVVCDLYPVLSRLL